MSPKRRISRGRLPPAETTGSGLSAFAGPSAVFSERCRPQDGHHFESGGQTALQCSHCTDCPAAPHAVHVPSERVPPHLEQRTASSVITILLHPSAAITRMRQARCPTRILASCQGLRVPSSWSHHALPRTCSKRSSDRDYST